MGHPDRQPAQRPADRELLHRYAVWHVLRRLRQRNRGADTTYGQLDMVRQRVRAAIGLLDWLRSRGLTLATCRQADLDTWLTSNDVSHRAEAGHFVRWAISQRINPNLQFAATRWTGPARPLDQESAGTKPNGCCTTTPSTPTTASPGCCSCSTPNDPRRSADSPSTTSTPDDDTVKLRFGTVPIVLPEPLATLGRDLAATRRGHAVLGDHGTSRWLFPGGQPGRPISADRLGHACA